MMIKKNRFLNFLIIITISLFYVQLVLSIPPFPTEFYGNVTTYNSVAPIGANIQAYDSNNNYCGYFNVVNQGYFGLLTCKGDDPYTSLIDEGPINGEKIHFQVNGLNTTIIGDSNFLEESFKSIWIVYPPIICGDNKCHKDFEDCGGAFYCKNVSDGCNLCESDINQSLINQTNQTIPPDGNQTPPSGGGGGSASGGGGGASGGGGAASGGGGSATGGAIDSSVLTLVCAEDWFCLEWSTCYINNTQSRTCYDSNECNTTKDKPPDSQECIYEGNCFDNIQNGLEEGIDCGGLCTLCPWEEQPTCFDKKQNCQDGICEEGVDCGGPCDKECTIKKPVIEIPLEICEREFKYNDLTYWIFLIFVIIAISSDYIKTQRKVKTLRKNESLDDVVRAKKIVHSKRNFYVFTIIISLISIMLLGYYHYFSQCQNYLTDFLWLLIIILVLTPLIGFSILKIFEYDEKNRIIKMASYFEDHHSRLYEVIQMHNKYLVEIENEISNQIYQLLNDDELKTELEAFPNLINSYKEMMILYDEYKVNAKPVDAEKNLVNDMYELINNLNFKELTDKYPKIKNLYDNIVLLFKQYEEKQKIYDEETKGVSESGKDKNSTEQKPEEKLEEEKPEVKSNESNNN